MSLNSLPSAANSSLPSAGTATEKSPRPSRWAATSRRWTSACSVRETVSAKATASARKPSSTPSTISEAVEKMPVAASSGRIWCTLISGPSKPCVAKVAVR